MISIFTTLESPRAPSFGDHFPLFEAHFTILKGIFLGIRPFLVAAQPNHRCTGHFFFIIAQFK